METCLYRKEPRLDTSCTLYMKHLLADIDECTLSRNRLIGLLPGFEIGSTYSALMEDQDIGCLINVFDQSTDKYKLHCYVAVL